MSELELIANEIINEFHQQVSTQDLMTLNLSAQNDQVIETLIVKQKDDYQKRLRLEFFELGPLTDLLMDTTVTEIIIDRESIWFEQQGQLCHHPDYFLTDLSFDRFCRRLFLELNRECNLDMPFLNGNWRSFRVHIVFPYDQTTKGNRITLRRINQQQNSLMNLQSQGWCSENELQIINHLLAQQKNLLVIGATGSGKTTTVSALLNEVPVEQRIVVVEDTEEIRLPKGGHTKLLTRSDFEVLKDIDLNELIKQSLRMRPDRIIVGEVRGAEATALLLALSSGHSGSMATLHASNPQEALMRLEMLVQMGAPQWRADTVRMLIANTIHYVISVGKIQGQRRLKGIYRVSSVEEFGFTFETVTTTGISTGT